MGKERMSTEEMQQSGCKKPRRLCRKVEVQTCILLNLLQSIRLFKFYNNAIFTSRYGSDFSRTNVSRGGHFVYVHMEKKDGKRSLGFVLGEWMYNPTTRVPLAARIFIYFIL